ncbi:methyltransferase [Litoribacillus peritrichatus]|uniref:tRNA (guanine(46)-N(7))-methyltransferase n=1 Tax=Litoribacillus peritrichatus TaxID=718191 RepID=A0ABP7MR88_9GAMM
MLIESLFVTIVLVVISSIVWTTLVLGISPMPSSKKAYQGVLELIENTGTGPIVDLGSGWGNLVIRLARTYPQRQIVGFELSFAPWLFTLVMIKLLGLKNLKVHRKNFLNIRLNQVNVIVCYLHPKAMKAIQDKISTGAYQTEYLVSNNFALPGQSPEQTLTLTDFYRSPVYRYKICEDSVTQSPPRTTKRF